MTKIQRLAKKLETLTDDTGHMSLRARIDMRTEQVCPISEYGDTRMTVTQFCMELPVRVRGVQLQRLLRSEIVECDLGHWIPRSQARWRETCSNPREAMGVIGTVIHGTKHPEDLIPALVNELFEHWLDLSPVQQRAVDRINESPIGHDSPDDLEYLFDLLNGLAPEGCYFGAHPDDGFNFGFWELQE